MEVRYELTTFGIKIEELQFDAQGSVGRDVILKYMEERRVLDAGFVQKEEESAAANGIVIYPLPKDVIVGRGRPYQYLPGNLLMAQYVERSFHRYRDAPDRVEKTCVAVDIVKRIEDGGGRFLERKDHGWVVADYKTAREKASQALRTRCRQDEGNNNNASTTTSSSSSGGREDSSSIWEQASKRMRFSRPRQDDENFDDVFYT